MTASLEQVVARPAVAAASDRLKAAAALVKARHAAGADGLELCRIRAEAIDAAIDGIWQAILAELTSAERQQIEERVTLVAHGGSARGEMTPGSDLDLMLLHDLATQPASASRPGEPAAAPSSGQLLGDLARRLLQDLFDAGLEVGQSVRTIAEAVQLASGDASIFSTMLEMRVLAGQQERCRRLAARLRTLAHRSRRRLARMLVTARRTEAKKYGDTVYLLQPNVKRSAGGQRDIQFARWLAFLESDRLLSLGPLPLPEGTTIVAIDPAPAGPEGIPGLSSIDIERLTEAQLFLRDLRVELHLSHGRGVDELTRDEQVRIAEKRGYVAAGGMLAVEQFMQDYFGHTREVAQITRGLIQQAEGGRRLRSWTTGLLGNRVDGQYVVGPLAVAVLPEAIATVAADAERIVRLVELSMLYEVPIEPSNWTLLRQAIGRQPPPVTASARQRLWGMFSSVGPLGPALRRLHELRLLDRLLPAFAHARCLLQFNNFHKYTVDEHCLLAVEKATDLDADSGWLGNVWRQIRRRRRLVLLALLIHDLGKGYEGDHSEVGAGIAREVATSFGLPEDEIEIVEFLVLRHLMMAELAFRRNVDDDSLVLGFAREVGSPEVLRMLTVLTMADIDAVGPGVWNRWKADLLSELYQRTLRFLDPDADATGADRRRSELTMLLAGRDGQDPVVRLAAGLPRAYLRSQQPRQAVEDLTRLAKLPAGGQFVSARWQAETATVSVTVGLRRPTVAGVFHRIAAGLASQRLEVLSADISTLDDAFVIDHFRVVDRDYAGQTPAERLAEIAAAVKSSLATDPPQIGRRWNPFAPQLQAATVLPPRVQIDNDSSADATIIEVFAGDSDGLLLAVARTLHEHQLSVRSAKISTYLDQIVDAFHVVDFAGGKLEDAERLAAVRRGLKEAVAPLLGPGGRPVG
jgi:[protein-PII] uridylyltransferase